MDLLVQVAGKHKMNPTGHTLSIVSEETGKMIDYRPNQAIGVLGVATVYLLPKMSKKDRKQAVQASRAKRPFEVGVNNSHFILHCILTIYKKWTF